MTVTSHFRLRNYSLTANLLYVIVIFKGRKTFEWLDELTICDNLRKHTSLKRLRYDDQGFYYVDSSGKFTDISIGDLTGMVSELIETTASRNLPFYVLVPIFDLLRTNAGIALKDFGPIRKSIKDLLPNKRPPGRRKKEKVSARTKRPPGRPKKERPTGAIVFKKPIGRPKKQE